MTLQCAPFWWVVCDAAGCDAKCPDDGDEYSAWEDQDQAIAYAIDVIDGEWRATADGRHFCNDHALFVCEKCGKYDPTPLAGEREYLCVDCWNRELAS